MATANLPPINGKRQRRTFYGLTAAEAEGKMRAAFPDLPENMPGVYKLARSKRMAEARLLGKHTRREWYALLRKHDYTCYYCGDRRERRGLARDHRVPVSRGGSDAIDNIVPACKKCNSKKGDLTDVEYLDLIAGRLRL